MSGRECGQDVCVTCLDAAARVRVVALLPDGLARVDTGSGLEDVCVDLVDTVPGDILLVHAGVAIGRERP